MQEVHDAIMFVFMFIQEILNLKKCCIKQNFEIMKNIGNCVVLIIALVKSVQYIKGFRCPYLNNIVLTTLEWPWNLSNINSQEIEAGNS